MSSPQPEKRERDEESDQKCPKRRCLHQDELKAENNCDAKDKTSEEQEIPCPSVEKSPSVPKADQGLACAADDASHAEPGEAAEKHDHQKDGHSDNQSAKADVQKSASLSPADKEVRPSPSVDEHEDEEEGEEDGGAPKDQSPVIYHALEQATMT